MNDQLRLALVCAGLEIEELGYELGWRILKKILVNEQDILRSRMKSLEMHYSEQGARAFIEFLKEEATK